MGTRFSCSAFHVDDNIPLSETVIFSPRYILEHLFSKQGIECDPSYLKLFVAELAAELTKRCERIDSTGKDYDCFISYRDATDKDVAEKLHDKLKLAGLKPFLDKECLPLTEEWKGNFLRALRGSKYFVALISTAGLAAARNHFIDHSKDNVLLEYQLAMEIDKKRMQDGNPEFIIPVLVGQLEGKRLTKFAESGFALSQYSDSVAAKAAAPLSGSRDVDWYGHDWGPWRYSGEECEGQRHGYGACEWPSHPGGGVASYVGQWQRGCMWGLGRLTRPSGDEYEGQLRDGRMHGRGRFTWATRGGRVYEGQWEDDVIKGRGRMSAADGTVEYDGLWDNDEPVTGQLLDQEDRGVNVRSGGALIKEQGQLLDYA
jgi:hypothetical protein